MGSELVVGFVLGVVSGLLTNYLWERRRRFTLQVGEWLARRRLPSYDPQEDELFGLNRWSLVRELTPDRLVSTVVENRPPQGLFDQATLDAEVQAQAAAGYDGANCYVVDLRVDHRESSATERFHVTYARSTYAEQMAVTQLLRRDQGAKRRAYQLLATEPREYLRQACPTSVAANVVVHSASGRLLAVRRSGAVDTAAGLWTIGIFETMIMVQRTKGDREDLFSLCERGLREEVGLEPTVDYPRILVSWFGIYGPLLRAHVVAHVRVEQSEAEVISAIERSEGLYEADAYEWIAPSPAAVRAILTARVPDRTAPSPTFEALGRRWLSQTKLSVYEAVRVRAGL